MEAALIGIHKLSRDRIGRFTVWVIAFSVIPVLSPIMACHDISPPTAEPISSEALLYRVQLSHDVIYMAIGETVPLDITAFNIMGDTLSVEEETITWSTQPVQSGAVVDSNGELRAISKTLGVVRAIGSVTQHGVVKSDTVEVWVVDTAYHVAAIRITPLDSSRGGGNEINPFDMTYYDIRAWDTNNQPIQDINVRMQLVKQSGFGTSVFLFPLGAGRVGVLNPGFVGELWLKSRMLLFGTEYVDSAKYVGLYPAGILVTISQTEGLGTIFHTNTMTYLQPCGRVGFSNQTSTTIQIEFDQKDVVESCGGNIPNTGTLEISPGQTVTHVLSSVGKYRWKGKYATTQTDIPGLAGTITVAQ
jgi:hypothetical protein